MWFSFTYVTALAKSQTTGYFSDEWYKNTQGFESFYDARRWEIGAVLECQTREQ